METAPVLLIVFNRPDSTQKVFDILREVKPSKLYVAADGPRNEKEKEICEKVRAIIKPDWECELHTLFHKSNFGCRYAPFKAINWLFETEEQGIILEDDCLADLSFFRFASELLEKYRDEDSIGMIAGHTPINIPCETSYRFSLFKACWGWATWKRAWANMDIELVKCNYVNDIAPRMVYNKKRISHWIGCIERINEKRVQAWDWPWYFSMAAHNQIGIFPAQNLVCNIGYGDNKGTHYSYQAPKGINTSGKVSFPLVHPDEIKPDIEFDLEFEKTLNLGKHIVIKRYFNRLPLFIRKPIKQIFNI